ncbi:MAG: hypothetical protein WGN25_01160 [Candidatus Electrothrix sp. GW3-4]|uniref:hypothetical protein n=1 Tax=Candidatus Electrothrix sp. GW3-4 TaxID=3126740 RepID=UPI0030CBBF6F
MGGFWNLFKQELKNEWHRYENMGHPPQNSGTGGAGAATGGDAGPGGGTIDQWRMIYLKFKQIEGRDPYSFQELVDWWNRI